jgi:hypothetical protein
VELLRDVRLDWIEPQRRRCDTGESQRVVRDDDVRPIEDGIAERDVDTEGIAKGLSRERANGSEAHAVVLHAVVLDCWMLEIARDLEQQELSEVTPPVLLKL